MLKTGASSSRNPEAPSSLNSQPHRKNIIPATSLSVKSVLLHDWWLVKAEGKRISVAGFASRERLGARVFFSAPICKRIYATTLETIDGITITINGFINRFQMLQNGFPFLVCSHFHLGFPYNWEEFITQCYAEESAKRDSSTEKSGLDELNISSGISLGTKANTSLPLSLDNLSAIKIRDLVMRIPEDSENCFCDYIVGRVGGNTFGHSPDATHSNLESKSPSQTAKSEAADTMRNCKRAKTEQMLKDDDDRVLDMKDKETKFAQSRGCKTRSMYSSKNPRSKKEDNFPLNSSVNSKNLRKRLEKKLSEGFGAQLSTSVANGKIFGEVASPPKASSRTSSSRQDKEHTEALDISKVRRSDRLKIQKSYVGMAD